MFAQLQVYQQEHPNCCGYHSMHNGALVLAALRQPRPDLASLAVALQDNVSFWRDLLRIQALLRTAEAARQPAGRRRCAALEEIESVVIERSMLALVPSAFEAAFGSAAVADRVTPVADWGGDWGSQWAPLEGALEALLGLEKRPAVFSTTHRPRAATKDNRLTSAGKAKRVSMSSETELVSRFAITTCHGTWARVTTDQCRHLALQTG